MHKVPKTTRQLHYPSRRVVVPVALEVLEVREVSAVVVEQGRCSHKTLLDNWAATLRNLSGTSRQ